MSASILGAGCTSDPTQSDDYLQLQSERADVESELADVESAADEAAAEAETDLELLRAEVVSLSEGLTQANASLESHDESLSRLAVAVEHLIAWDMWIDADAVNELGSLGLDLSVANQIVIGRDWGDSWVRYAERQGFDAVVATRRPVGAQELDVAWARFLATAEGSDEEFLADWDYTLQLWATTLERYDEALSG